MTLASAFGRPDFRSVFEATPGLLIIVAPDLTILAVNDSFCLATMTSRDDIVGRQVFEVFPDNPDDPDATGVNNVQASFERVLQLGRPDAMVALKYDIRRPESEGGGFEERYWTLLNSPVFDADGQVACIINSVEDVTQLIRLKAEGEERGRLAQLQQTVIDQLRVVNRQLADKIVENKHLEVARTVATDAERRSAEILNRTLESVGNPIIVVDAAGTIVHLNLAAVGLVGSPATFDDLRTRVQAFLPDGVTPFPNRAGALARALQGESTHNLEVVLRTDNREGLRFLVSGHPILDPDGTIAGAVAVFHDITEMRSTVEKSEERFRRVVESAPNAMVMINASGMIEMINTQAERVFGYKREELLGEPVEVLVPLRFRGHHPGLRQGFFDDPRSRPMGAGRELYGLRKDGKEFPVEIGLNPIETEDGTMVLSSIVDISARKRLEEHFRRVVESAPNAMVMIDSSGRIQMVNTQAERVFGYSRSELLGQSIEILVPVRFRNQHPGLRNSFFGDPLSRPMGAGRELYGLRKDGKEFPVEIGLNPIETEDGAMVLSSIVDISARKRLEEHFRRVVESAPNAMVMINTSGRIVMVNAQAERVFGYSRTELLGQAVELLVPARFRHQHPGLRNSFLRDPHSRPMGAGRDLYGLRKDGSEFPVEIGLNPIETEEGTMVLSAIVDISDRKQREERVQAALKEKDILLSEIHHRVKNNLQVIHSLLDLQSAKVEDKAALQLLKESQNRIRSMALIHQALYESNDFMGVDFGGFLDTLVPSLVSSYSVDPGRISLLINSAEVSLPISTAVPCGLIVNELISNALKHGFPDGRRGHINIDLSKGPDDEVVLSVSDDGVGIKSELDLADVTTLGLQLVSLLTDQLGGRISMQRSNPTRFELRFRVQP